ncbi:hypothetical protein, partial [Alistipes communis]
CKSASYGVEPSFASSFSASRAYAYRARQARKYTHKIRNKLRISPFFADFRPCRHAVDPFRAAVPPIRKPPVYTDNVSTRIMN